MADVPFLNDDDNNDDQHHVLLPVSPDNNHWPHDLGGLEVNRSDFDSISAQDFFCCWRCFPDRSSPIDRENQVNFATDMFHQRVEQSQSQSQLHYASRVVEENSLVRSDRSFGVIEGNDYNNSNEFDLDFGLGLGFPVENLDNPNNDDGDDNMISDSCYRHGVRSESGDPSNWPDSPELYIGEIRVTGEESDIVEVDDEANLHLCLHAFHLEDDNTIPNPNANPDQDFDWEEVDDRIQELHGLEWEVLSNVENWESNPDLADQYELFFGQIADNDVSGLSRPPASVTVVKNLLTVVIAREEAGNGKQLCAVCKDELSVGEIATQLPCSHCYHGDCIVPWLEIRNTCPVCRHELPTDDLVYERMKTERDARA